MANRDNDRIAAERKRTGSSPWIWIIGAIVIIVLVALLFIPLFDSPAPPAPASNATISEIVQAPGNFEGQSVLVTGEVSNMLGANGFLISPAAGEGAINSVEMPVIFAKQGLAQIDDQWMNDGVFVAGTVRELDIAAVENDIGYDLDNNLFTDWVGKPVLVATAVQRAGAPAAAVTNVTIPEISTDPATYVGQTVIVNGAVAEVVAPTAFWMQNEALAAGASPALDSGVLVVGARQDLATIDDQWLNDNVLVAGRVRNFDMAAFEQEIGYGLDDAAFQPFAGKPAVIATSIQAAGADAGAAAAPGVAMPFAPATEGAAAAPLIADANVTVADITGNFQSYVGKTVAVRGEVEERISPFAFSIDEEALLQGGIDNDLLVIGASSAQPILSENLGEANVAVLGTVRQFNIADVENEIGYGLDDNLFTDWNGRPVLIARAVQVARGRLPAAPAPAAPGAVAPAAPAGELGNVTVADIAGNLPAYVGQTVTVRSEVEDVLSPTAFKLDEDGVFEGGIDDDILVVSATQNVPLDFQALERNTAIVTGMVRQFNIADVENEIGYDLDDALFTEWAGRPVIVATAVEQVAE